MLADVIESDLCVFIYEILLYLQMQLIFSKNTRLRDGSVVWRSQEMCYEPIQLMIVRRSPNSRNLEFLNEVGKVFHRRHHRKVCNLGGLYSTWFGNCFRGAARQTKLLCLGLPIMASRSSEVCLRRHSPSHLEPRLTLI